MYESQQASWGFVPNYARAFSHRPEVMKLWANLQRGIRCTVDPRRFELVTLAAALALRSSYCSLAHAKALTAFFTESEVGAIVAGGDAARQVLTEAEMAMMDYAAKAATHPWQVTAGEVDSLRRYGFSDGEIFDIAAVAAARAFFSGVLEAVGVEADVTFTEVDESLREALTVGRPISWRAVEQVESRESESCRGLSVS
jgi:uncharacterized peroxidase-related enzyme